MSDPILIAKNVSQSFQDGSRRIEILKNIDLTIHAAEHIAILGASGSGKSTLLHVLAGLDKPTHGEIILAGQPLNTLTEIQRSFLRNVKLGFVYQFHHLLPEFTALENVCFPLLIRGDSHLKAKKQASLWLEKVGLKARLHHKPHALSGGERQRVAIARAMVHSPACIFADEPTGNLDAETAADVYGLMQEATKSNGTSVVVVTHDTTLAAKMDAQYQLVQGVLT